MVYSTHKNKVGIQPTAMDKEKCCKCIIHSKNLHQTGSSRCIHTCEHLSLHAKNNWAYIHSITVKPLITNSPNSENLSITDCFCGSRCIAMCKKITSEQWKPLYNKLFFRSQSVRYREVLLYYNEKTKLRPVETVHSKGHDVGVATSKMYSYLHFMYIKYISLSQFVKDQRKKMGMYGSYHPGNNYQVPIESFWCQ